MLETCRRQGSDVPLLRVRLIYEDNIANSVKQATRLGVSTDPLDQNRQPPMQSSDVLFSINFDGLCRLHSDCLMKVMVVDNFKEHGDLCMKMTKISISGLRLFCALLCTIAFPLEFLILRDSQTFSPLSLRQVVPVGSAYR
jgi:hypothetical protein